MSQHLKPHRNLSFYECLLFAESRYPGRALQLHEKLSSPARKREPHETFRFYQVRKLLEQDQAAVFNLGLTGGPKVSVRRFLYDVCSSCNLRA
jgi:hypothetical protein